MRELRQRRAVFFQLRGLLAITVVFIVVFHHALLPAKLWMLGTAFLVSDLVIPFLPLSWFRAPGVTYGIFFFDMGVLTILLYSVSGKETDSLLLYYLTVFLATVGRDVRKSIGIAVAVGAVYIWLQLNQTNGILSEPGTLVRIPLFFVTAVACGYLAEELQRQTQQTGHLKEIRKGLEGGVAQAGEDLAESEKLRAAAEASERRFHNLLKDVDAIVWEMDARTFRFTFVSQQAEQMLGYPVGRWVSELDFWSNRIHPEDRERVLAMSRKATSDGAEFDIEYRALAADGRVVWLRDILRVVRDAEGRITQLRGVMVDITEHKRTEEALRESEGRFRLLVEHAPAAIAMLDNDMRYLATSRRWLEDFRLEPEDIIGRSHYEIFPEVPNRWREVHQRCLAGAIERCEEDTFPRPDGTLQWIRWEIRPWRHDTGEIGGIIIFSEDISERKRAEEALRAKAEEVSDLYNNAPWGYHSLDKDGVFIRINDTELKWLAYSRGEIVGKMKFTDIIKAEGLKNFQTNFAILKERGWVRDLEFEYVRKDGTLVPVLLSATALLDRAGNFVMSRSTVFDISERKQLEAQLRQAQKMEAVGRLAGGVAHDFNNLLTIIGGYSQLLLDLDLKDQQRGHIEEVKKAADRAASLTRQLLAFSRQQVLAPQVLDLNVVVANTEKMLRRLIGEDIELVNSLGSNLGRVKADPGQIEQVILNLAVNARDAMPRGGRLTIETANLELDETYARGQVSVEPGPYVMLSMSDTGSGMDAETQTHIFEPFFTTKEPGKGTGLGLATVYGIVKQSGGYIWVNSEEGHGATFKIFLPQVQETAEVVERSSEGDAAAGGSETILLVEDEEPLRRLARGILEGDGYTVLEACGGEEALQVCGQHKGPIHLILTDVVMSGMSGRELAERLAVSHPESKVVYMSGYTDDSVVRHGVLDAGTILLQKPFTPDALAHKVRETLDDGKGQRRS
jgi:PAS domain S-box-containing protein